MKIVNNISELMTSLYQEIKKTNETITDNKIIAEETETGLIYNSIKSIDRIITFIVLLLIRIIPIWKIRGAILSFFIECTSVPAIGYNVYFVELLTRKYVFGKNVSISYSCELVGPLEIGDFTVMSYNVQVRPHTLIGKNVDIGPNAVFITDTHELGNEKRRAGKPIYKKIIVEDGCWIGANTTILGGVTIGAGSIVSAGSVVATDIKPNSLVIGDRAKEVRELRKMNFLRRS